MILRYHPAFKNAIHECSGKTTEDTAKEQDNYVVEENCQAGG